MSSHSGGDGEESGKRAYLSHFKRPVETENPAPPEPGLGERLAEFVDARRKKIRKAAAERKEPISKKKIAIVAAAVAAALLAIAVATKLPLQFSRSAAFFLHEEGRHNEALPKFRSYLRENRGDAEAALAAAQSALSIGKDETAAEFLQPFAGHVDDPEFKFTYALAFAASPSADQALDDLIAAAPDHLGGRLLRGVILTRDKQFKRAREDFLYADSIIRSSPEYDVASLRAAHLHIVRHGESMLRAFDMPLVVSPGGAAARAGSGLAGFPIPLEIYAHRYAPALPAEDFAGDDNIVALHYALMLMYAGQLDEAAVEFSKMPSGFLFSSEAGVAQGILHALGGDYERAAKIFSAFASRFPQSAPILFNLASAQYASSPDAGGVGAAKVALDQALAADGEMRIARYNRAAMRLFSGDARGASEDIAALDAAGGSLPSQAPLLRIMAAVASDPQGDALGSMLEEAGSARRGALAFAGAARHFAEGSVEEGLRDLGAAARGGAWSEATRLYSRRLEDAGLLMRAHYALERAPASDLAARYRRGILNLATGRLGAAQEISQRMQSDSPGHFYATALYAAILAEEAEKNSAAIAADALAGGVRSGRYKNSPVSRTALASLRIALESAPPPANQEIALDHAEFLLQFDPLALAAAVRSAGYPTAIARAVMARLVVAGADTAKDLDAAIQNGIDAAMRSPFSIVQYHAGIALADAGRHKDALPLLAAAVRGRPLDAGLLLRLAEAQYAIGREKDANRSRQAAVNVAWHLANPGHPDNRELSLEIPDVPRLRRQIALAKENKSNMQSVLSNFNALIDGTPAGPKRADLLFQRATFHLHLENYSACVSDIQAALADGLAAEKRGRAEAYLGVALAGENKHPEAEAVHRRLAAQYPSISFYRRLVGRTLTATQPEKAADYLRESVEMFPADLGVYFDLATNRIKDQDHAAAVETLHQAARVSPLHAPIYRALHQIQGSFDIATAQENSIIHSSLVPR